MPAFSPKAISLQENSKKGDKVSPALMTSSFSIIPGSKSTLMSPIPRPSSNHVSSALKCAPFDNSPLANDTSALQQPTNTKDVFRSYLKAYESSVTSPRFKPSPVPTPSPVQHMLKPTSNYQPVNLTNTKFTAGDEPKEESDTSVSQSADFEQYDDIFKPKSKIANSPFAVKESQRTNKTLSSQTGTEQHMGSSIQKEEAHSVDAFKTKSSLPRSPFSVSLPSKAIKDASEAIENGCEISATAETVETVFPPHIFQPTNTLLRSPPVQLPQTEVNEEHLSVSQQCKSDSSPIMLSCNQQIAELAPPLREAPKIPSQYSSPSSREKETSIDSSSAFETKRRIPRTPPAGDGEIGQEAFAPSTPPTPHATISSALSEQSVQSMEEEKKAASRIKLRKEVVEEEEEEEELKEHVEELHLKLIETDNELSKATDQRNNIAVCSLQSHLNSFSTIIRTNNSIRKERSKTVKKFDEFTQKLSSSFSHNEQEDEEEEEMGVSLSSQIVKAAIESVKDLESKLSAKRKADVSPEKRSDPSIDEMDDMGGSEVTEQTKKLRKKAKKNISTSVEEVPQSSCAEEESQPILVSFSETGLSHSSEVNVPESIVKQKRNAKKKVKGSVSALVTVPTVEASRDLEELLEAEEIEEASSSPEEVKEVSLPAENAKNGPKKSKPQPIIAHSKQPIRGSSESSSVLHTNEENVMPTNVPSLQEGSTTKKRALTSTNLLSAQSCVVSANKKPTSSGAINLAMPSKLSREAAKERNLSLFAAFADNGKGFQAPKLKRQV